MYKILVPYNFNDESKNALKHAGMIAARKNAKIDILHIVDGGDNSSFSAQGAPSRDTKMEIALVKMIERLKEKLDLEIKSQVNMELLDQVDIKVASFEHTKESIILDHKADLIVMGTEGFHASQEVFVSSLTEKVADDASIPVVVVGEDTPLSDYDHVVYASHFEEAHPEEMTKLATFLMDLDARLDLVKVTDEAVDEEEEKRLLQVAHSLQLDKASTHADIVKAEDPEEAIESYMERSKADVLTLNAHHLTGIARFFKSSMIESFINRFKFPVMVMNVA